jgi:hypothetical protein
MPMPSSQPRARSALQCTLPLLQVPRSNCPGSTSARCGCSICSSLVAAMYGPSSPHAHYLYWTSARTSALYRYRTTMYCLPSSLDAYLPVCPPRTLVLILVLFCFCSLSFPLRTRLVLLAGICSIRSESIPVLTFLGLDPLVSSRRCSHSPDSLLGSVSVLDSVSSPPLRLLNSLRSWNMNRTNTGRSGSDSESLPISNEKVPTPLEVGSRR